MHKTVKNYKSLKIRISAKDLGAIRILMRPRLESRWDCLRQVEQEKDINQELNPKAQYCLKDALVGWDILWWQSLENTICHNKNEN